MKRRLLGCFFEKMFCQCMLLNSTSFKYLCQVLAFAIVRIVTNMKACILVETKFAITLS
jgi:hypothetical protein